MARPLPAEAMIAIGLNRVITIRHKLTDEQWESLAELFPSPKPTGRPRLDL